MGTLKEIVDHYDSVSLQEMDTVRLMNRIDTKFVFNSVKLPQFLEELMPYYKVLEVCATRMNRYETLYFDTPDLKLYTLHHNGKLNRYKVRTRKYVDSDTGFFEIKFKNNRGRTIKSRIKHEEISGTLSGKSLKLIRKEFPLLAEKLQPTLRIFFTRLTFVNNNMTERVTLDVGLRFSNANSEHAFQNIAIAEVKQDRCGKSGFTDLMRKNHIETSPMSKYCLAVCSLDFKVKKNNFKQKLLHLNKINHEIS